MFYQILEREKPDQRGVWLPYRGVERPSPIRRIAKTAPGAIKRWLDEMSASAERGVWGVTSEEVALGAIVALAECPWPSPLDLIRVDGGALERGRRIGIDVIANTSRSLLYAVVMGASHDPSTEAVHHLMRRALLASVNSDGLLPDLATAVEFTNAIQLINESHGRFIEHASPWPFVPVWIDLLVEVDRDGRLVRHATASRD